MLKLRTNYLIILILFCSCSVQRTNQVEVIGVLYDSETEAPIKNAIVQINLTDPWELEETKTGDKGEFSYSTSSGIALFEDPEDFEKSTRKVKVSFEHPEFVEDYYEDELVIEPIKPHALDVGAFYLSPKEKQ